MWGDLDGSRAGVVEGKVPGSRGMAAVITASVHFVPGTEEPLTCTAAGSLMALDRCVVIIPILQQRKQRLRDVETCPEVPGLSGKNRTQTLPPKTLLQTPVALPPMRKWLWT